MVHPPKRYGAVPSGKRTGGLGPRRALPGSTATTVSGGRGTPPLLGEAARPITGEKGIARRSSRAPTGDVSERREANASKRSLGGSSAEREPRAATETEPQGGVEVAPGLLPFSGQVRRRRTSAEATIQAWPVVRPTRWKSPVIDSGPKA